MKLEPAWGHFWLKDSQQVGDLAASQADSPHRWGRRQRSPAVSAPPFMGCPLHSFSPRSSRLGLRGGGPSVLFLALWVEEARLSSSE